MVATSKIICNNCSPPVHKNKNKFKKNMRDNKEDHLKLTLCKLFLTGNIKPIIKWVISFFNAVENTFAEGELTLLSGLSMRGFFVANFLAVFFLFVDSQFSGFFFLSHSV